MANGNSQLSYLSALLQVADKFGVVAICAIGFGWLLWFQTTRMEPRVASIQQTLSGRQVEVWGPLHADHTAMIGKEDHVIEMLTNHEHASLLDDEKDHALLDAMLRRMDDINRRLDECGCGKGAKPTLLDGGGSLP